MKKKNTRNIKKLNDKKFEEEFEKTDFSKSGVKPTLIKASQRKGGRPKIGRKLSIILPENLIVKLQHAGKKRGVGYQTMIRMICSENINDYISTKR